MGALPILKNKTISLTKDSLLKEKNQTWSSSKDRNADFNIVESSISSKLSTK